MTTIQIEVPEGKRAEWVNGVLTLVDNVNIIDKIKTPNDAREYLKGWWNPDIEIPEDIIAYRELRIIVKALNEGEEIRPGDIARRYMPLVVFRDDKYWNYCRNISLHDQDTDHPFMLTFKTPELALYCVRQFWPLWRTSQQLLS